MVVTVEGREQQQQQTVDRCPTAGPEIPAELVNPLTIVEGEIQQSEHELPHRRVL